MIEEDRFYAVQLGLDAEHAWVPALLRTARNDSIKPGAPGFVNCSLGVVALRVPTSVAAEAPPAASAAVRTRWVARSRSPSWNHVGPP